MVEIVDEEVELHLIDTRQLVEEAKKLKEAQQIKDEQKNVLKKDPAQIKEEKELLQRLEKGKKKSLTSSQAPTPFTGEDKPVLPDEAKKQTRVGAVTGQKTANVFTDAQKKIKELEKKQKELKKQFKDNKDFIMKEMSFAKSGITAEMGVGGLALVASRFGPMGAMVAAVAIPLIIQYQKQFERGGALSIYLKEKVQAKTITDEEQLNQVRSGNKFLTDDLRIVQGAPQNSNTQNLKYEHIRFTAQQLGQ